LPHCETKIGLAMDDYLSAGPIFHVRLSSYVIWKSHLILKQTADLAQCIPVNEMSSNYVSLSRGDYLKRQPPFSPCCMLIVTRQAGVRSYVMIEFGTHQITRRREDQGEKSKVTDCCHCGRSKKKGWRYWTRVDQIQRTNVHRSGNYYL